MPSHNAPDRSQARKPHQRLHPARYHAILRAVLDIQAEGSKLNSRAICQRVEVSEATARKYLKEILDTQGKLTEEAEAFLSRTPAQANHRPTGGPKTHKMKRDLMQMMEATTENLAQAGFLSSQNILAAAQSGGRLDLSAVQLLTAFGISLDKLTLYRREEQSQIWMKVLNEEGLPVLDAMLGDLEKELARLEESPMVTR